MNLVLVCAALLMASTIVEGGSRSLYTTPVSNFPPGNNDLTGDAIATSLQDANSRLLADLPSGNTSSDATRSQLNSFSVVSSGTKTYVAGLRSTAGGNNFCCASLISPTHLLVGTYGTRDNIRWASIGSHYVNGTQDGEQIKVVAILNHPKSSNLVAKRRFGPHFQIHARR
ncbi:hypothetical protein GN958_ATG06466 [Phytophthora infestans]|uniref:Uncharacterized protein n=1 Tax=Phytophthora infestans TaxID=4787 RepID=A0A8S9UYW8_PHYIN|nr:hypothetical protein GN958_ATG06466 [Phytophthora infestans]